MGYDGPVQVELDGQILGAAEAMLLRDSDESWWGWVGMVEPLDLPETFGFPEPAEIVCRLDVPPGFTAIPSKIRLLTIATHGDGPMWRFLVRSPP